MGPSLPSVRTFALVTGLLFAVQFAGAADQDYEYRLTGPPTVKDNYAGAKGLLYTITNVQANGYGGYADVATRPRPGCTQGGGQRFRFIWNFDRDVTDMLWNKPVEVRMMIQGDGPGPCSNQNPFMRAGADVLDLMPILSDNSSRVVFDPRAAGRPNIGAVRTVRYMRSVAEFRPAQLNIEMTGFSGAGYWFGLYVNYSFKLAKVSVPPTGNGVRVQKRTWSFVPDRWMRRPEPMLAA